MDITPTSLQRDTELYLDTLITFQVNDTIFKVPPKYIHENSEVFGAGSQISAESGEGSSDAHPVKLSPLPHDCTADDFRCLLKIIMALTVGLPIPTNYGLDKWLSVLKLSTAWYFSDVRTLAMEQVSRSKTNYTKDQWITVLDFAHNNSVQFTDLRDLAITRVSGFRFDSKVDQVLLGRKYLHKPWIIEGFRELANVYELPSLAELRTLGKDTLNTLLYMAFNRARNEGRGYSYNYDYRGPYSDHEVEEHFHDEIAALFPAPVV
ncbi:hypothetical protein E1B28_010262 [Marasmius oreades]|uniref:Uncharacterized protein n=1 Tax=Marasmius oreades TaxID=181124 RepID=A0A9P7RXF1_9AGAR|nr:uncharacterized protein E1B28_010262 [Marasmius oreades]KAG7091210.1 hypothetical protein E1B28_010262 [Marasmius oreades]